MSTETTLRRRRAGMVASALILGAVIAAAALARTAAAHSVAAWLGIRTAQEPYTALSFTQPAEVGIRGVTYRGRQVHDRVRFSVRNAEHRREHYRWTISFTPHGRRYRGALTVAAGASATVSHHVLLPCARLTRTRHAPRVQVRVRLLPGRQTIDYWQVCGG